MSIIIIHLFLFLGNQTARKSMDAG